MLTIKNGFVTSLPRRCRGRQHRPGPETQRIAKLRCVLAFAGSRHYPTSWIGARTLAGSSGALGRPLQWALRSGVFVTGSRAWLGSRGITPAAAGPKVRGSGERQGAPSQDSAPWFVLHQTSGRSPKLPGERQAGGLPHIDITSLPPRAAPARAVFSRPGWPRR